MRESLSRRSTTFRSGLITSLVMGCPLLFPKASRGRRAEERTGWQAVRRGPAEGSARVARPRTELWPARACAQGVGLRTRRPGARFVSDVLEVEFALNVLGVGAVTVPFKQSETAYSVAAIRSSYRKENRPEIAREGLQSIFADCWFGISVVS